MPDIDDLPEIAGNNEPLEQARHPRQARDEAIAEIVERQRKRLTSPEQAHDEAVRAFDFAYGDLTRNPELLRKVIIHRQSGIERATREGRPIEDWNEFYTNIGEEIRHKAKKPSGEQLQRAQILATARKARNQNED